MAYFSFKYFCKQYKQAGRGVTVDITMVELQLIGTLDWGENSDKKLTAARECHTTL